MGRPRLDQPRSATDAVFAASSVAGPRRPPGVNLLTAGIAETMPSTSRATKPIPPAATVEPVTTLPRNVIVANASSHRVMRIVSQIQPTTGSGSNRSAV